MQSRIYKRQLPESNRGAVKAAPRPFFSYTCVSVLQHVPKTRDEKSHQLWEAEDAALFPAETARMEPKSCAGPRQIVLTDDTAAAARNLAAVKDTDTIFSYLQRVTILQNLPLYSLRT
jgi:hypothetical protein